VSALPARAQSGILVAALVAYWIGFALFPPATLGINDEVFYVHQAEAFAHGRVADSVVDPLTGRTRRAVPSTYPVGTSLLQAPFVRLGGWRAAPVASALALTAAVIALARWIALAGGPPLAALLFLGFPPTLVLGRTAMSDVPGALIVTLGLWLFWLGQQPTAGVPDLRRARRFGFGAGLCAGLSLLFRETDVLLFLPLVAGVLLRRRPGGPALLLGGMAGVAVRLASSAVVYGNPLFVRDPGYGLSLSAIAGNAPLYLFALVVLIPGGLLAGLAYRGPRRPEIVVTTVLYVGFFLAYSFSGLESGGLKRLVVGPRFFIPLAPVLAFAAAERLPAWLARWGAPARAAVALYAAGVVIAAFAVHVVHGRWSRAQAGMAQTIHDATRPSELVVTNLLSTGKLFPEPESERPRRDITEVRANDLPLLTTGGQQVALALLDRSDTPFFLERTAENARFLAQVAARCRLTLRRDQAATATDRLRIWGVGECRSGPADEGHP
jgi:4-amino-4-deoxy-L-arabinose transferase-like glycosyltransferase